MVCMLQACGGSEGDSPDSPGLPPTAGAVAAEAYNGGEIAMLDGAGSTDPDGDPLRYTWTQTGGANTVALSDHHAARPLFEVPNADDTLTFSLVVNDGYDDSAAATVTIDTLAHAGTRVAPLRQSPFRGSYGFAGAGEDMAIAGDHVYLAAGINGLHVVSIADPVAPTPAGIMAMEDAHDVALIGDFAYHITYDDTFDEVHVFASNVADPTAPALRGQVAGFGSPSIGRLAAVGDVLYVVSGDSLRVYRVTDTADPVGSTTFHSSISLPAPAEDIVISGDYAYVAAGEAGLRIFDVRNATAATPAIAEAGGYDTAGSAVNVAVSGSHAYVADEDNGLVILDITTPASPALVTTIAAPSGLFYGVLSVDVSGGVLYFSADFDVWIYDVGTPASPALLGRYRAGNLIRKVRASGSYLYVTDTQGLRSIPVDKVSLPRGPALYTAADAVREVKLHGDLAFVRMDHSVDILDMRNAGEPALLSSYAVQGFENLFGMAIVDSVAYLSQGTDKLQLLHFRNPAAAVVASTVDVGTNPQMIVTSDTLAYVYRNAFPNADVAIYDISEPTSPTPLGYLSSPHDDANWLREMVVHGNWLYLTELNTNGTFWVADVSDPTAPALVGSGLGPVDLYSMAIRNDYVVAIGNNTGVKILDVSKPETPAFVGAGYDQPGYTISVAATRAYTNSDFVGGGVKVLDVSDPLAPSLAGELTPAGGADTPIVEGPSLYTMFDGVELHRHEREPMLESRHVSGTAGAALSYAVSWLDAAGGDDHAVKCWVSGGSCTVRAIDQTANTAALDWSLPDAAGDHEIMIAVGNGHYFGTALDRVQVR
jgi:hypothetical protein